MVLESQKVVLKSLNNTIKDELKKKLNWTSKLRVGNYSIMSFNNVTSID